MQLLNIYFSWANIGQRKKVSYPNYNFIIQFLGTNGLKILKPGTKERKSTLKCLSTKQWVPNLLVVFRIDFVITLEDLRTVIKRNYFKKVLPALQSGKCMDKKSPLTVVTELLIPRLEAVLHTLHVTLYQVTNLLLSDASDLQLISLLIPFSPSCFWHSSKITW